MIPIKLHLSGFLSYLDPVDVDFESFDLACISGQNGAGKSSLLDAITWVLFGEARRRDDSIINNNAEAAEVVFTFDYENSRYKVQRSKPRGKTTLLEFSQQDAQGNWHPLTEATLRATDERIVKTLRLDYETFINASFFLQGKADQFAQQRPSDRKRILSNTLGLEVWETYKEEALRRRHLAEADLAIKEDHLRGIDEELAEEPERKVRLSEAEKEYAGQKSLADTLKAALDKQRQEHERYERDRQQFIKQQTEFTRQQQEIARQNQTLLERQQERGQLQTQLTGGDGIKQALAQWKLDQAELEKLDDLANHFQTFDAQRQVPLQEIAAAKAGLVTKIQQLSKVESEIKDLQLSQIEKKTALDQLQKIVSQLTEKVSARATLETDLRTLADERASARAENQTLMAEMKDLKERIDRLSEVEGADCPLCGQPLSEPDRVRLLQELQEEGKEKGAAFRKNQQAIKDCETRYQELEKRIQSLQALEPEAKTQQRRLDTLQYELNADEVRAADWQLSGAVELQALLQTLEKGEYAPEARQKMAALEDQMKALGYDASAHAAVREAEKKGRASQEAWLDLEKARARLEPLEREIAGLHQTIDQQEEHLKELESELSTAQQALEKDQQNLPDLISQETE